MSADLPSTSLQPCKPAAASPFQTSTAQALARLRSTGAARSSMVYFVALKNGVANEANPDDRRGTPVHHDTNLEVLHGECERSSSLVVAMIEGRLVGGVRGRDIGHNDSPVALFLRHYNLVNLEAIGSRRCWRQTPTRRSDADGYFLVKMGLRPSATVRPSSLRSARPWMMRPPAPLAMRVMSLTISLGVLPDRASEVPALNSNVALSLPECRSVDQRQELGK
jgi:hypothetical protein